MNSVTQPTEKANSVTALKPHNVHLAIHFTDKETGRLVDYAVPIGRQPTAAEDVKSILGQLEPAVRVVLEHAVESADAVITLALLKRG